MLLRDLKDFRAVRAVPSSKRTREEEPRQRNKMPGERALGTHIGRIWEKEHDESGLTVETEADCEKYEEVKLSRKE